jgi:hypothetical protein
MVKHIFFIVQLTLIFMSVKAKKLELAVQNRVKVQIAQTVLLVVVYARAQAVYYFE